MSRSFDIEEARRECRKQCNLTGTYRKYGKERGFHCHAGCRGHEHWLRALWRHQFDWNRAMMMEFDPEHLLCIGSMRYAGCFAVCCIAASDAEL